MKKLIELLKSSFATSRELVVLVPLSAGVLYLLLLGISYLTGRPSEVSLVPLAEFGISLVKVTTCAAFAAILQASALGYRAPKAGGSLADDVFDASVFIALLLVFLGTTYLF
jgi:hypothetical protein